MFLKITIEVVNMMYAAVWIGLVAKAERPWDILR